MAKIFSVSRLYISAMLSKYKSKHTHIHTCTNKHTHTYTHRPLRLFVFMLGVGARVRGVTLLCYCSVEQKVSFVCLLRLPTDSPTHSLTHTLIHTPVHVAQKCISDRSAWLKEAWGLQEESFWSFCKEFSFTPKGEEVTDKTEKRGRGRVHWFIPLLGSCELRRDSACS